MGSDWRGCRGRVLTDFLLLRLNFSVLPSCPSCPPAPQRDCQNFLLRSQPSFLAATTLYQVGGGQAGDGGRAGGEAEAGSRVHGLRDERRGCLVRELAPCTPAYALPASPDHTARTARPYQHTHTHRRRTPLPAAPQAGQVVTFLKGLGLKDDMLAARVLCVWPELLGRDVDAQLRPVVTFLMSLGLEVAGVGRAVVLW